MTDPVGCGVVAGMNLQPFLSAPVWVQVHAAAALVALCLGLVQLVRRKGDAAHRAAGYVWCALMAVIAGSSFAIGDIDQWRGFSLIHLLSIWTLVVLPFAVLHARRGAIGRHRTDMISLFVGALIVAGALTLLPGRIMHRVVLGG